MLVEVLVHDYFDRRDWTKAIGRLIRRFGELGCRVDIKTVAAGSVRSGGLGLAS